LLIGLGKAADLNNRSRVDILRAIFKAIQATPAKEATLFITDDSIGKDSAWLIKQAIFAGAESDFRADGLKSKPAKANTLKQVIFASTEKPSAELKTVVEQTAAISNGMALTKELGNLPGNICTPTYLAAKALALGKSHKTIKTTVLEEQDMQNSAWAHFYRSPVAARNQPN